MKRALVDANVFVSFLLYPRHESPSARVVRGAFADVYELLLPEGLLDELTRSVAEKPYLAERIRPEDATAFENALSIIATTIPAISEPIPRVSRDPKDDYLLAYALIGNADYLVTGDLDLLTLEQVGGLKIITPREFADLCQI